MKSLSKDFSIIYTYKVPIYTIIIYTTTHRKKKEASVQWWANTGKTPNLGDSILQSPRLQDLDIQSKHSLVDTLLIILSKIDGSNPTPVMVEPKKRC